MSFNELAKVAIANKDLNLWKAVAELRMQVLLASGSPEGTARFNKLDKLNVTMLGSSTQYGTWRDDWVRATEDVEGMLALWSLIARRIRTVSGHVPDSKSVSGDSVGIRQLLGPEADMSTAQLGLLDRLERILGVIEGIDDPDELQPGDWLLETGWTSFGVESKSRLRDTGLQPLSTRRGRPPARGPGGKPLLLRGIPWWQVPRR